MFPGNPHDHSPCSSTPAGPSTRYGTKGQRTRHGPRTKAQRGLPTIANFGAQSHGFWSRCLRLEVEVTRHRARLASGCWSQLCRAGFDPQGFYERFLNWNSSSLPELHGASFVLALFYHHQLAPSGFTDDWPLSFRFTPHAPRRPPLGPAGSGRAQTLPRWRLPATDRPIAKNRTGPISTSGSSISVCHRTRRFCGQNNLFFSTRRRSPVDRSLVAKALNVSGFRRACPMAISRNACSLLDFPEFAQAVRYGVPGTPLRLSMYFLPSAIAIAVAPNSRSSAISSISLSMASLIRLPRE